MSNLQVREKGEIAPPGAEFSEALPPVTPDDLDKGIDHTFGVDAEGHERSQQVFVNEALTTAASGLREREGRPITDDEIRQSLDQEEQESGEPLPVDAKFEDDDNPFAKTEVNPESPEAQTFLSVEQLKKEMQDAITEVGVALAEGDTGKAAEIAHQLFERVEQAGKERLPEEVQAMYGDIRRNLLEAIKEKNPEARSRLFRFACGAADFVPVVGPAKMLVEASVGKTLGGEEIEGWKRLLHGTEGAVFLALDLTGVGAVGTKGGKLAAKLGTRTAALMRALKVPRAVYRPIYKFGRMLVRYPKLGQAADRGIEWLLKARKLRKVTKLPEILRDQTPTQEEKTIANVSERPGMSWPPDEVIEAQAW